MNGEQQHDADAGSGVEDMEFSWDEYLEDTGAVAAPHGSFKHVDTSLQNGFAPGMKLEVAVKSDQNTYWVATIITTCGQLLLLRYDGYGEDRKADFWCDIMTADLHPIGWCEQNEKVLKVPEGIKDKIPDQEEFLQRVLKGACSAPANLLEGLHRGKNPLDLIAPGSRLELQNSRDALEAWIVNVVENVGGRLKLRYEGLEDSDKFDQWIFYLDPFLHQVGWATQNGYNLQPPLAIRSLKSEADWQEILKKVKEEEEESSVPTDLFKDKPVIGVHSFSEGMKLEAVDPMAPFVISPATVLKVYNEKYFMIEIDDLRPERATSQSYICHVNSAGIFPVQWSLKNGIHLSPPPGYPGQDFDWADYLKQCGAEAAPQSCFPSLTSDHGFKENMKLEAVNPVDPEEVCIATVTKLKDSYLWLQLEGSKKPIPDCIVSVESMNIFPVGWCETNGYQLRPPRKAIVNKQKKIAVVQPEKQILSSRSVHDGLKNQELNSSDSVVINGKYCCPKIYFNHRCFSGPYLNKGRIAELPQSVGPGNCVLVLKEVLTLLINAAYKPSRVLRELQLDEEAAWHGHGETLKAKYKGKSYRATVEVVRTADRVADFCRKTCIKLECCPNLFGPQMVLDKCSENCSVLTKTKYTHYYGKRKNKRIGRPPGGHSNLEVAMKKPNKRRKKRKHFFVHKKKRSSTSVDNTPAGSPQGSGGEEEDDQDEVDEESLTEDSTSEQQDELLEESEVSEKKSLSSSPTQSELSHSLTQDQDKRKRKLRTFSFSDDENKPPSPKEIKIEVAEKLQLDSNPLEWSVADVVRFLKSTDCAPLARIFLDQEIDGQALLLLTLPTVQECMDLKLGPAIKLCHHIERVKLAFYQQFAN
ncbi:scm-like with four MBT domains protein 1 isoform X1 [Gallus gallus]|uniref:scm-like with four MBT domains protein 1 isoform X1 n=1 Tax=Gallus gallus TaxID=9031 RepID=UPI00003AA789|nr:scm-like with four MBT domains protein 1 isoform X1 [Gallus gallus]XP_015148246.1 scm-like with four MBT domains protein 1 isoform X1 [Gallus gallus]XP_025010309.1 scm-like with four MBT domains protein 1 isoform X1 [Gallus gallus]XP_040502356.1 scm-like with four MBT domains protein 1 isoform X1 [Gallus gallus]XP_040502358.1 scm-like with four MBT domains protein 1 isoform X1 [Gallus gallus]XP_040502359.1 scm-like with four MBT domains protein 1 isoform X1 [Gallus gallus]XP_040502360.1 sc|eukprot:XP_015148245.1 scm-like with four MBT domains protein 1 isoform X1 [Gallus gallus]